mmetsp:Transcript_18725/g.24722  ORF Transcript_18725/g.24722 Transcript_18725/m.24722 type:complete len:316 (-) Transcript_18725:79-1026(-)
MEEKFRQKSFICILILCSNIVFVQLLVMGDCIFEDIQRMQLESGKPWGHFLDAGTGVHSLKWICDLETDSWTALTAAMPMAESLYREQQITTKIRTQDDIVIGNWDDPALLYGKQYNTVLADYLIGAMDGFSPFKQDLIFERLKPHIAPEGRLYVVGLEPIPEQAEGAADVICQVVRLRDSCIKLAGHRCYREYPLEWIERTLIKSGYKVVETKRLPILYSFENIKRQIDVASSKLPYFKNSALREAMRGYIKEITNQVRKATNNVPGKKITLGFDYIVCAEPEDYVVLPPPLQKNNDESKTENINNNDPQQFEF